MSAPRPIVFLCILALAVVPCHSRQIAGNRYLEGYDESQTSPHEDSLLALSPNKRNLLQSRTLTDSSSKRDSSDSSDSSESESPPPSDDDSSEKRSPPPSDDDSSEKRSPPPSDDDSSESESPPRSDDDSDSEKKSPPSSDDPSESESPPPSYEESSESESPRWGRPRSTAITHRPDDAVTQCCTIEQTPGCIPGCDDYDDY